MPIRLMNKNDLEVIVQLEEQLFSSAWSKDDYVYEIDQNPYGYYCVLEENQHIIGYIGLWIIFEQIQITTIGVDKEYQGKGYADMLMQYVMDVAQKKQCQTMSLEVRVSNQVAVKLYQKYGFEKVSIRKNYYKDNHEDAYLMIKELEVEK